MMKVRKFGALTCALLLAVALAACGSSSSKSSTTASGSAATPSASASTPTTTTSAIAAAADIQAADALLAAHTSGVAGTPPTQHVKAPTGKSVWYISCSEQSPPCNAAGQAIQAAGKVLGWNVTVFDGKGDPAVFNQGVQSAISAHANAILFGGVDCPAVAQSLRKADAAHIITAAMFSYDCNDAAFGSAGKPLFTDLVQSGPQGTGTTVMDQTGLLTGKLMAAYAIAHSDGKAQVLVFDETDLTILHYITEGFEQELATCSGCKILTTVPFTLPQLGPAVVQKARTALLQYPSANWIYTPNDPDSQVVSQAVAAAGKAGSVKILGSLGDNTNIAQIKKGGPEVFSVGFDTSWIGWAGMDDLVRLFAGQKPVYSGWAVGEIDQGNAPANDVYHSPVHYETLYPKLWGK